MKKRQGFVSNSSSSSFIIIGEKDIEVASIDLKKPFGTIGEMEFGWGPKIIEGSVLANFNWAGLISKNHGEKYHNMLKEVIIEIYGDSAKFDFDYLESNGYIDHQSNDFDLEGNAEMFEDKEALKKWLFCPDSKIELNNDNESDDYFGKKYNNG